MKASKSRPEIHTPEMAEVLRYCPSQEFQILLNLSDKLNSKIDYVKSEAKSEKSLKPTSKSSKTIQKLSGMKSMNSFYPDYTDFAEPAQQRIQALINEKVGMKYELNKLKEKVKKGEQAMLRMESELLCLKQKPEQDKSTLKLLKQKEETER